jgi:HSP20 family protein
MFWRTFNITRPAAPSPWQAMARFEADLDELFGERAWTRAGFPRVNVWTNEEGARVVAELPGVAASDLELTVEGDTLTLKGARAEDAPKDGAVHRLRERRTGSFARTIQLPFHIEAGAVKAVHKNGLLDIELPRAAAERPRKIAVRGTAQPAPQPEGETS